MPSFSMQYIFYSLSALLFVIPARLAVAESSATPQSPNQYPAEFISDYQQECLQTSLEEGLAEAEAQNLCSCTIEEFSRQYTLEEFKQVTAASTTDRAAETALVEVGQFCFEQLLYAE
ncbi:MAG: hypothetical protein AAFO95_11025 [Cyanobacteria bacterium J06600_6]